MEVGDTAVPAGLPRALNIPIFSPPDSGVGEEQPEGGKRGAFLGNAEAWGVESQLDGGPARSSTRKKKKEERGCVAYFFSPLKKDKANPNPNP